MVRPDLLLWAVADGAGGHNAGNVASALALTSISNYFESSEHVFRDLPDVDRFGIANGARRLSAAVRKANADIVEISKSAQKYGGMGSTIVVVTLARRSQTLHVAHCGDSRCYRLRGGCIEQLTHDHSLLNDVLEMHPDLPETALAKLPRHVVTRALGMEETVRATVRSYAVAVDDIYLLCSDGLTGEVDDERIRSVLTLQESPAELCERLIRTANEAGGKDNIAVVVIAFDAAQPSEEEEAPQPGAAEPAPVAALAPPAVDEPRATEPRAAEPPAAAEESRGEMISAPEIVLLGIQSDVDPEEALRVVPSESKTSNLYRALGGLLSAKRSRPTLAFCTACGAELSADVTTDSVKCPRCGEQLG
jgi:protein phosphatase